MKSDAPWSFFLESDTGEVLDERLNIEPCDYPHGVKCMEYDGQLVRGHWHPFEFDDLEYSTMDEGDLS